MGEVFRRMEYLADACGWTYNAIDPGNGEMASSDDDGESSGICRLKCAFVEVILLGAYMTQRVEWDICPSNSCWLGVDISALNWPRNFWKTGNLCFLLSLSPNLFGRASIIWKDMSLTKYWWIRYLLNLLISEIRRAFFRHQDSRILMLLRSMSRELRK